MRLKLLARHLFISCVDGRKEKVFFRLEAI